MSDTVCARDLMRTEVIKVREEDSAADLCDVFQQAHVHGAPVVDDNDNLVGMVSQEDILMGSMTWSSEEPGGEETDPAASARRFPRVSEIMTSPAISAEERTTAQDLCTMMWRFRIHHIPIVRKRKVTGMVSSLDICRAIADGVINIQD